MVVVYRYVTEIMTVNILFFQSCECSGLLLLGGTQNIEEKESWDWRTLQLQKKRMPTWLRLSRLALWSLLNNSGLDGHDLLVCWNPDCLCRRLLPKSRHLPFSGFLPLDILFPAVGDILRSGRCRCVCCRGSLRPLLRISPTARDKMSRERNPENGRRRDFGRRRRHRQLGFQHTDRPRPSSPELFNKDEDANS